MLQARKCRPLVAPCVVDFGVCYVIANAHHPPHLKTYARGSSNLKENSQTQHNIAPLAWRTSSLQKDVEECSMVKTFACFITLSAKSGAFATSVMMDMYLWNKDVHCVWRDMES